MSDGAGGRAGSRNRRVGAYPSTLANCGADLIDAAGRELEFVDDEETAFDAILVEDDGTTLIARGGEIRRVDTSSSTIRWTRQFAPLDYAGAATPTRLIRVDDSSAIALGTGCRTPEGYCEDDAIWITRFTITGDVLNETTIDGGRCYFYTAHTASLEPDGSLIVAGHHDDPYLGSGLWVAKFDRDLNVVWHGLLAGGAEPGFVVHAAIAAPDGRVILHAWDGDGNWWFAGVSTAGTGACGAAGL